MLMFFVDHNYFSVFSQNCLSKELGSFNSNYLHFSEN